MVSLDSPANDMPFISAVRSQIESILLVIDTPAKTEVIARAVDSEPAEVEKILDEIKT